MSQKEDRKKKDMLPLFKGYTFQSHLPPFKFTSSWSDHGPMPYLATVEARLGSFFWEALF